MTGTLRRSRCDGPGIRRRRYGSGFGYYNDGGGRVTDAAELARIEALAVPPAWRDVWICPWPNGHLQATGLDAAGRRQYRYHDQWRVRRDAEKHDRILQVAETLPALRSRVADDLATDGLGRCRVLAGAIRLLDLGFFRVGGEAYADEHSTYGLATLRKNHVRLDGDALVFDYEAKGGKRRVVSIVDAEVLDLVRMLKQRRGGRALGDELLVYKDGGGRWRDVTSTELNEHLRAQSQADMSAKDFRTWHATVLMAVALAVSTAASATSSAARDRAVARAYREVAGYLGNTPAVCRNSYVDPRVVEMFDRGETIAATLDELGSRRGYGLATQGPIEKAVLRLLRAG